MRRPYLLVLASLVAACRAPAPAASVIDREADLAAALLRRDSSVLDRLLHPDFPAAVPEHVRLGLSRGTWISVMVRRFDLDTLGVGDVAVALAGDTARARLWMYWRGRVGGTVLDESLHVADTWIRRRGRWYLAGREVFDCRPQRAEC